MMASDDLDRLRHGFSAIRVTDHNNIENTNTPPTPTTPTSRMHLLSALRTQKNQQQQTPLKVRTLALILSLLSCRVN